MLFTTFLPLFFFLYEQLLFFFPVSFMALAPIYNKSWTIIKQKKNINIVKTPNLHSSNLDKPQQSNLENN
jgi:hypothetical protein